MAVAIVGYGYRFPGGITSDDEIDALFRERGVVRIPVEQRYGARAADLTYVGTGQSCHSVASGVEALLCDDEEVFKFDCVHFGINKGEAGVRRFLPTDTCAHTHRDADGKTRICVINLGCEKTNLHPRKTTIRGGVIKKKQGRCR